MLSAFFLPLLWVFIAELGDKTQLVALCFATRFKTGVVMAGVFVATLVVHIGSVLLGGAADKLMPKDWVSFAAGLAFIGFGMWTIRGDECDDDSCLSKQGRSPFWIVATTFFLAELGDKTMLTTVAQAAVYPKHAVAVWVGSSLGMVVSDGLAIIVGKVLGTKLPERAIKIGASILFFMFGVYSIYQGGKNLDYIAWTIGTVILLIFAYITFRGAKAKEYLPVIPEMEPEAVKEEALINS